MRKIVLNISDVIFEKLRFEAMEKQVDIKSIIQERLLEKPFSNSVEEAYDNFINQEYERMEE